MPYVDTNTIHNPATGTAIPASWGDQVRDNLEFLIDPPACSISTSAAKSCGSVATTVLGDSPAATENFDNDAMHSNVTNPSRITIQTPGRYLFVGNVVTDAFIGGNDRVLRASFRINGTTSVGGIQVKNDPVAAVSNIVRLPLVRTLVLIAGDYVEMTIFHDLGGTITVVLDELAVTYLTR